MSNQEGPHRRRIDNLDSEYEKKLAALESRFDEKLRLLREEAFPQSDLHSHKEMHQKEIDDKREWSENWKGLRKRMFEGLSWAVVLAIAGVIWTAFKEEIRK